MDTPSNLDHFQACFCDGFDVLDRFAGEPDHEVQLDRLVAAREDNVDGIEELLLADRLIDNRADVIGSGFRREGEPRDRPG